MDAVVFDMDGVLVDVQRENYEAWSLALNSEGYDLSRPQFDDLVGLKGEEIARAVMGESVPDGVPERVKDRKTEAFLEKVDSITALDGVRGVLEEFTGRYELAVATSGADRRARAIVREIGVDRYFSHVVTAGDVTRGKPDPEIVLTATERLNVPAERAVVIEDSPHGVRAARRAGAAVVGVTTTHAESELDHADLIVDHPNQLDTGVVESLDAGEGA